MDDMQPYPSRPSDDDRQPGVVAVRPLVMTEMYGAAIATMRRFPLATIGIALVIAIVDVLAYLPLTFHVGEQLDTLLLEARLTGQVDPDAFSGVFDGTFIAYLVLTVVVTVLAWIFLSGILTAVTGRAVAGQPAPLRTVLGEVARRMPAMVGLMALYLLALIGFLLLVAAAMAVGRGFGVLVLIAAVPVLFWVVFMWALATPALILERIGPARALGRSWQLVQGSWWRTFGILMLAGVIAGVIAFITQLPFTSGDVGSGILVGSTVVSVIVSALTQPFVAAVTVLLYVDRRVRRENFVLQS